jgi:hypothetical protein
MPRVNGEEIVCLPQPIILVSLNGLFCLAEQWLCGIKSMRFGGPEFPTHRYPWVSGLRIASCYRKEADERTSAPSGRCLCPKAYLCEKTDKHGS